MAQLVEELCAWYHSHCDGDWEHQNGVKIRTLDNPGWAIDIMLVETSLAERAFDPVLIEETNEQWMHCRVRDGMFQGRCGPLQLGAMIHTFLDWARSAEV